MSTKIEQLEKKIERVKQELLELGPVRPGSLSRQYKDSKRKKGPFYQLSYTHQMKSRSEYVRPENLSAIRSELANFRKFRKLIDQWVDLALKLSKLKTKMGVHANKK